MNKRIFFLELIVGFLGLILVLLFGEKGLAVIALLAISLFLKKKSKQTAEDTLLFHKVNTITFAAVFVLLLILYFTQDCKLFTNPLLFVKDVWFYIFVTFTLFAHGAIGLMTFNSKKS